MKVGLTLSPGGLLLPYHIGVLSALQYHNVIDQSTLMAGSSAGAIACASFGCQIPPHYILEATIQVSDRCHSLGGARGRLLPLLNDQLHELIQQEQWEQFQQRQAPIGIAYKQIFPQGRNILQQTFASRHDLFQAVSYSCMFPFFASQWPCMIDSSSRHKDINNDINNHPDKNFLPSQFSSLSSSSSSKRRIGMSLPRLLVDGYFTVPRDRFGCPYVLDLLMENEDNDDDNDDDKTKNDDSTLEEQTTGYQDSSRLSAIQEVAISVFPRQAIGLTGIDPQNVISPHLDEVEFSTLIRLATQASSREELTYIYELGWKDAERWWNDQQKLPIKKDAKHPGTSMMSDPSTKIG